MTQAWAAACGPLWIRCCYSIWWIEEEYGLVDGLRWEAGQRRRFKRLGFILERFFPEEGDAIAVCRARMTKGKVSFDPSLAADRLATAWQLWVPSAWAKKGLTLD